MTQDTTPTLTEILKKLSLISKQAGGYTEEYGELVSTVIQSIPQILTALKAYNELYPCTGGCTSLSVAEVFKLQQLKERVEDRITKHEEALLLMKKHPIQNDKEKMFICCLEDSTRELQQLLKSESET